ncbi:unnamed protein product [Spirodela intermedia]|uniref:Uncharacterized protein n=1 Tax=Spirodela intermedia TaxID=51605 RepID=A0ABN7ECY3_SPIIN|nr:unnamed protein product [Spirodela intermedia]
MVVSVSLSIEPLGGGAVLLTGASATWFLFEIAGYSFLSLAANVLLLLVSILFLWARSVASLLNRLSFTFAEKIADDAASWILISGLLQTGYVIVFCGLLHILRVSYSFLTFVYLGKDHSFLQHIPCFLNDKYQDHIDEKCGVSSIHFLLKSI